MRQVNQIRDWAQKIRMGEFSIPKPSPVFLFAILSDLFVLIIYVWLISIGHWTQWPATSGFHYYDSLASSFSHAQLSLEIKPDPALLMLSNPYDPNVHIGITYPQDVSLYNGKFYLYFGPAPAIVLLIAKVVIHGQIGDQYLVFAFLSCIFLLQSLLIVKLRQLYFPDTSIWLIGPIILMVGLMSPFVWILANPSVNNAAITAGQFFFLAGFYSAFSALASRPLSKWKMAAAGLLWVAAIGSRFTHILPVGLMVVLICAGILLKARSDRLFSRSIPAIVILISTLGIGLAFLGWYNWARFNSVFETGLHYQLVNMDLKKEGPNLFSPAYILQNLYVYFLNLPKLGYAFPYLSPLKGIRDSIIPLIQLPAIYYTQDSTGILYSSPFVLFALVPVVGLFLKRQEVSFSDDPPSIRWLIISLCGSFLSAFVGLAVFFWVAERYVVDFIPALTLLSVIGFWQLDRHFAQRPLIHVLYWVLAVSLIVITITVSGLLALSLNSAGFRALNPELWRLLGNLARHYLP
jgi:hypothetical protein